MIAETQMTALYAVSVCIGLAGICYSFYRLGVDRTAAVAKLIVESAQHVIDAQQAHIESLRRVLDINGCDPDDDPDGGEEPGIVQEKTETIGNVIPMKKVS